MLEAGEFEEESFLEGGRGGGGGREGGREGGGKGGREGSMLYVH